MAASQSLPCFHFLMEDKLTNCVGAAASEVKNIICSAALNLFSQVLHRSTVLTVLAVTVTVLLFYSATVH